MAEKNNTYRKKSSSKSTKGIKKTTSNSKTRTAKKVEKEIAEPKPVMSPRAKGVIYGLIAALFVVLILFKGEALWTMIRSFMFGLFGIGIIFAPIIFGYLTFCNVKKKTVKPGIKFVLCVVAIVIFTENLLFVASGTSVESQNYFQSLGSLFSHTANTRTYFTLGGGLISGILGYPCVALCGSLVTFIVSLLCLVASLMLVCKISINDIGEAISKGQQQFEKFQDDRRQKKQQNENDYDNQDEFVDYGKDFTDDGVQIDIPLSDKKSRKNAKSKKRSSIDIAIDNEDGAVKKKKNQALENFVNANKEFNLDKPVYKEEKSKDPLADVDIHIATNNPTKKSSSGIDQDFGRFDEESNYTFPSIDLLHEAKQATGDGEAEMNNNAKKLISTLESFGVDTKISYISRGPSVTRYEIQPAPGVKISKITNLADDIALNLAANGVRIEAPIPGKAAVGIEVPNKIVSTVSMRELIDSQEFRQSKSKLTCVLGKDIAGNIVTTDLAKMPHLLVAGTTGSGKSVCVNSLLISILYKATPDEVKLLLIDPKMVEFAKYKGLPHLLVPVVSDAKKAAGTLAWAVNEMEKRYTLFAEYECKEIDSYNNMIDRNLEYMKTHAPYENEDGEMVQPKLEVNGIPVLDKKMERIVIAIDEFADLMMTAPHDVEDSVVRIAQKARAAGIHLVIATQRPTANVITGLIKANVPSRISLKVSSNMDSRVILDTGGAEKLIGRGDMLYAPIGAFSPTRVQGCFATDAEIEGVTHYIKEHCRAQYNKEAEEQIKLAAQNIGNDSQPSGDSSQVDVDAKMEEAIKIVIEAGQASTSMLQRRLKVGYARAGRMIDDMETLGVVGPHQGSKPREVLMTYNQWLERNNINE